ncbi:MAG: HD domain-containing protein [Desulfobacterales bacterium]|nr:HD domain-containing protein [Desulfobacterales bacterium]
MNIDNVNLFKQWFNNYTNNYFTYDDEFNAPLILKKDHTFRVCENIISIGKELFMSKEDLCLAEVIGLFHDVGRFEQFLKYRTFKDSDSESHSKIGIRELSKHKILAGYERGKKRLICNAISYHNVAVIPKNKDERTTFFIRLIRDADKLDIWNLFSMYCEHNLTLKGIIGLGFPDEPICSEPVVKALYEHRFVWMGDLKTLNDFKLFQISWIFDLNFIPSFRIAHKNQYIKRIAEGLPKDVQKAVKEADDYLEHQRLVNY